MGDIMQVAVDIDAGKIWFGKNGAWWAGGDPAAGTGAHYTGVSGSLFPMASSAYLSLGIVNFGASAFAYTVPSGFNAGWYDPPAESSPYERIIEDGLDMSEVLGEKHSDLLDESFGVIDLTMSNSFDTIEDIIDFFDQGGVGNVYLEIVEDSASITGVPVWRLGITVSDTFSGVDVDVVTVIFQKSLFDTLFIYDDAPVGWHVTVPESLIITDAVSKILTLLISEWLTLIDTQHNNWDGVEVVPETLSLYDLAKDIQRFNKTIDESLVATDAATYRLCLTLLEYLGFTELATAMKDLAESVSESLTLTDDATRGFDKTIADTLATVDVSSVLGSFVHSIAESLVATDLSSLTARFGVSVTDPLVFTEAVTNLGHFYMAVYDTLHMNVVVELAGEIYECYVLNTPKFYPSMYSGFDFNSYAVFENRAFAANDVGIYELTGSTDAGNKIHTGAILSETDFGSPNQKRFRRGYLGISGDAPVMVLECENGQRETYSIDTQGKTVFSSDLKSKSWKISIADFDELSTIKLIPVILTK
jgi:hypothetical protein